MLEAAFLLPQILSTLESEKGYDELIRDTLLLSIVLVLEKCNICFPRTAYCCLGLYVLGTQIANDLSYKFLPPHANLKKTWLDLQSRQIKSQFVQYIELFELSRKQYSEKI